ncbi:hypothetical protein MXD59_09465 [Frankia sp. Ag45/Mut15]|uniref:MarR family transcriptional regulator n=1 Tax=Frankia umida TaxID=573489 RepID=A0ABT0JWS1_9ACTN|nr:hypothetical protein [Frankia umida]MCK9876001.1 hypothetical protein [Frankia umida]
MRSDPLMTVTEVANHLRLTASSWREQVAAGTAPPPDDPDTATDKPEFRRRPRWHRSTLDTWNEQRRIERRAAREAQAAQSTQTGG